MIKATSLGVLATLSLGCNQAECPILDSARYTTPSEDKALLIVPDCPDRSHPWTLADILTRRAGHESNCPACRFTVLLNDNRDHSVDAGEIVAKIIQSKPPHAGWRDANTVSIFHYPWAEVSKRKAQIDGVRIDFVQVVDATDS